MTNFLTIRSGIAGSNVCLDSNQTCQNLYHFFLSSFQYESTAHLKHIPTLPSRFPSLPHLLPLLSFLPSPHPKRISVFFHSTDICVALNFGGLGDRCVWWPGTLLNIKISCITCFCPNYVCIFLSFSFYSFPVYLPLFRFIFIFFSYMPFSLSPLSL